jgi:hypothetical protein
MKKLFMVMALWAAGCGSPSSYDLCNESCEARRKCGILSDAQAQNCKTDCNNTRGQLNDQDAQCERDCTNCGKIRGEYAACAGVECNKLLSCISAVDNTCIRRQ